MKKINLLIAMLLFTAFNYTAQAVETQTAACTPGNLATVAASYLTTVTNLTVTGTIDARDFKTMRDDMPLLEVVDLSGSIVAAYTGTGGTVGTTSKSYSANGIPDCAFYNPSTYLGKTSLKTFVNPSVVTSIGGAAFRYCSSLIGQLSIPSTVTTIGGGAFIDCNGLTGTLTLPSLLTSLGANAFYNCSGLTGSLNIPSTITEIGYGVFYKCTGLTGSLTIPSSITSIGYEAFYGCTGFTGSLTIPSSVITIGYSAFAQCSGLSGSLTIPSSVERIDFRAFKNCSGFNGSLTIPSSVTSIGIECFYGCSGLTSIYASSTTPFNFTSTANTFWYVKTATCVLHVPVGSKGAYETAYQWQDFTNIVDDVVVTSVEDTQESNAINIFPNPATSYITISELGSLGDKIVTLSIVDVSGSPLLVKEVDPTINVLPVDVSTLKKGIYFISVQTSNGSVVKRFVKE